MMNNIKHYDWWKFTLSKGDKIIVIGYYCKNTVLKYIFAIDWQDGLRATFMEWMKQ